MAEVKHHLIVNKILEARSQICYDRRGEESVSRVACQLVQTSLIRGDPIGGDIRHTRSVRVGGNGPVGQLTGHLLSLSMAVRDGLMRKGDGP
jgi:hypothetical protein